MGRPPGGLTAKRGRGVLGLGGLRACEGVESCDQYSNTSDKSLIVLHIIKIVLAGDPLK